MAARFYPGNADRIHDKPLRYTQRFRATRQLDAMKTTSLSGACALALTSILMSTCDSTAPPPAPTTTTTVTEETVTPDPYFNSGISHTTKTTTTRTVRP